MEQVGDRVAVVIDDDADVRELIEAVLTKAGFRTVVTSNGADGVAAVRAHDPLLTTVDVQMPGMDGFEATRAIRAASSTYLIMVTALTEEEDVLAGFEAGADDYLTKPFRARELSARAESMLRRPRARLDAPAPVVLEWNGLRLDPALRACSIDGREVELTRTEYDLVSALLTTGRRVRSKADLVLVARGAGDDSTHVSDADRRTIEVHVGNLRRKLGDDASRPRLVETVRGLGYRMAPRD